MKTKTDRQNKFRKLAITSVLAASVVCYICIFNLMECPSGNTQMIQEKPEDKKEVSLPEVEIMKTVLERARDVFTIMSRTDI